MKIFFALSIFGCFLIISCSSSKYDYILLHRKELLRKTENTSLATRNNSIIFSVTNGNFLDEYFLRRNGSEMIFVNHLKNHENTSDELDTVALCKKVQNQLSYIEEYQIYGYTAEFKEFGVLRNFYLDDYEQLLYIPNPDSLKGSYKDYVSKGKLLVKDWYLYKE